MLYLLYRWGEWAEFDEPKTWLRNLQSSAQGIVSILRGCTRQSIINGKKDTYFALKDLEYFVSRDEFAAAVATLPPQIAEEMQPEISKFREAPAGNDVSSGL